MKVKVVLLIGDNSVVVSSGSAVFRMGRIVGVKRTCVLVS